ncbi:MAG: hypothetical protein J0L97_05695, partial [Alphaproteobacteria bacterium]|nr:hypothetical protein [Alphaproteobacteria bacterium]
KFDILSKQYFWMESSRSGFTAMGIEGDVSTGPMLRRGASCWTDGSQNVYIYGGQNTSNRDLNSGMYGDIWMYRPSSRKYTFIAGVYGADSPGTSTFPGPRVHPIVGLDSKKRIVIAGGALGAERTNVGYNNVWVSKLCSCSLGSVCTANSTCNLCPNNQFSPMPMLNCAVCAAGTDSIAGSTSCNLCVAGKSSTSGSSCTPCSPGKLFILCR